MHLCRLLFPFELRILQKDPLIDQNRDESSMVWSLLTFAAMTNTEFLTRNKCAAADRLLRDTQIRLRWVDGAIVLAFVGAFLSLLLILSK